MAGFYSARSETIPPLPWPNFAPPFPEQQGQIFFHDIGDYLTREDKLSIVRSFGSIRGITARNGWQVVEPDEHGDWLKQRDSSFTDHIAIGDKKSDQPVLFANYSAGLKSQRDAWAFNSSRKELEHNIQRTVTYYNRQLKAFSAAKAQDSSADPDAFTKDNLAEISWSTALKNDFDKQRPLDAAEGEYVTALYRPFYKQWLYFSRRLNERQYQIPRIFPEADVENRVISVVGAGGGREFSTIMTATLPDLEHIRASQCFPLKLYEKAPETDSDDLFAGQSDSTGYTVRDGITDEGLKHFQRDYPEFCALAW